jgi:hypothetical protein
MQPIRQFRKSLNNTHDRYESVFIYGLFNDTVKESGYLSRYIGGLRAGRPGLDSRHGKIFLFSTASTPVLSPPSLLSNGYRGLFPPG